ncbi:MAG: class IV adenylate cyclase [Tepidisphaeraceae bacterium]
MDPPYDAPRRNIELKSRLANLSAAREAALRLGARDAGLLEQTDTYFHCTTGRLKLRETVGRDAELIAYARPDHPDARASDYHLISVAEPGPLKRGLANALGVRVVVVKRRQLLIWHDSTDLAEVNVRIHLDEVQGLGSFCEFEAVLGETNDPNDESASTAGLAVLADALGLHARDRIATSYCDLLEAHRPR